MLEVNEEVIADALVGIGHFEGCHLTSYVLPGEKWATVGWGNAIPIEQHPLTITQSEADKRLRDALNVRIQKIPSEIGTAVWNKLTHGQKVSYLMFRYNCKDGAWLSSKTRKALMMGDLKLYRNMARTWCHDDRGMRLAGLFRRRECECFLWDGGTIEQLKARNWFMNLVKPRKQDIFGVLAILDVIIKCVRFAVQIWQKFKPPAQKP